MFPHQQQNDSNDSPSSKHSWTCFHKYNNTTFINICINHNLVSFSLSGISQLCIASILPFCSSACLTVSPVSPVILLFLISETFPPSSQLGINLSKVIQGVILFDFWPLLATKLVVGRPGWDKIPKNPKVRLEGSPYKLCTARALIPCAPPTLASSSLKRGSICRILEDLLLWQLETDCFAVIEKKFPSQRSLFGTQLEHWAWLKCTGRWQCFLCRSFWGRILSWNFCQKCPFSGARKWVLERPNKKTETTFSRQHPPKMVE